jgi:hypothetical protein
VGSGLTNYQYNISKVRERIETDKKYYLNATVKNGPVDPYVQRQLDKLNSIDMNEIQTLLDFKNKYKRKVKKCVQMIVSTTYDKDRVSVYTNDEKIIDYAVSLQFSNTATSVANICIPEDVKIFVRPPKYKFRAYMKNKSVDRDFKDKVLTFLEQYPDFNASGSFKYWLNDRRVFWKKFHLQQNFFLEYNDEASQLILLLYFDNNCISKFFRLEQKAK